MTGTAFHSFIQLRLYADRSERFNYDSRSAKEEAVLRIRGATIRSHGNHRSDIIQQTDWNHWETLIHPIVLSNDPISCENHTDQPTDSELPRSPPFSHSLNLDFLISSRSSIPCHAWFVVSQTKRSCTSRAKTSVLVSHRTLFPFPT
jgi:hypothetical protein